jgi:hypothetical protein
VSGATTATRRRAAVGLGAVLALCVVPPSAACVSSGGACTAESSSRSAVVAQLGFVRQSADGTTVEGFDLDGRVSTSTDAMGCRQPDFTSADGTRGIDNQLAMLLPVVDSMTGGALEGAVQGAINNGQQLLAMTLEGLDSACDDPEVTLVIQRVAGMPFVGADMRLDPGQTFDALRDAAPTRVAARVHNGELEAGPFTLPLPVAVLTASFTLNLYGARVRARLLADGGLDGIIGGGIDREEFMAQVRTLIIGQSLMNSIGAALSLFADLDPGAGGRCTRLSSAVRFSARSTFVNP